MPDAAMPDNNAPTTAGSASDTSVADESSPEATAAKHTAGAGFDGGSAAIPTRHGPADASLSAASSTGHPADAPLPVVAVAASSPKAIISAAPAGTSASAAPLPTSTLLAGMPGNGPLAGRVRLGTVDVDLADEGLGALRMTALSRAGLLHVSLAVGDPLVRGQLIDHAADLRREITAAGIDVGSFDVGSFTKHNDGSALTDRHSTEGDAASTVGAAERQPGAIAPPGPTSTASTSRLDLRI
jgi:hypothetical protein